MSSLPQIQPNNVPIFLTEDFFYTTAGGEGFHEAIDTPNGQTYVWATYNDLSNQICGAPGETPCTAQDIAGLSHEIGEWADDPFGHTPAPCSGGYLEVGDPLNNYPYTPYTVGSHLPRG